MGSRGQQGSSGSAGQLPRTTPHISSTHHRLARQGHHHQSKDPPPLPPPNAPGDGRGVHSVPPPGGGGGGDTALYGSSMSTAMSNFRDASSSRSLTPHPFANSLKKPHHPPVAPGQQNRGQGSRSFGVRNMPPSEVPTAPIVSGRMVQTQVTNPKQHSHTAAAAAAYYQSSGVCRNFGKIMDAHSKIGAVRCSGGNSASLSPMSMSSNSSSAAASSFFARAAQKVGSSSSSKKKRNRNEKALVQAFPTNFSSIIVDNPPPEPYGLLRPVGCNINQQNGKVKVMLRICPVDGNQSSFLSIDPQKKQVTAFDPSSYGHSLTSASSFAHRRPLPPKMFGFDAVFSASDPLKDICATSLTEIIQAVVGGSDGCLFCYGHARIGKTYTMMGLDDSPQTLGVIPCAISWLFRLINEQKEQTGARFSVRVSAVEVTSKKEILKDLLADIATAAETVSAASPGMYLREDPVCGTQLENQSELRAPTAERAAFFLDAAIAARTVSEADEDARNSHLLFTIHVYQYRVETSNEGQNGVAGGRSRLHLIDFGSCSRNREGSALSLSALGTVIMALLNGQRHVPYRESTLAQLIKESLGSLSCHACMIVHVSPALSAYNETLQVMQLATRLQRMRTRRRTKFSSTSSEDSSCDENARVRSRMRLGVRMGTLREGSICGTDCTSSSEQSCDTVIYMGGCASTVSDREMFYPPPAGLIKMPEFCQMDDQEIRKMSGDRYYAPPSPPSFIPQQSRNVATKLRMQKFGRSANVVANKDEFFRLDDETRNENDGGRKQNERWIDGFSINFKNSSSSSHSQDREQWVDGPPEFRMERQTKEGLPLAVASESLNRMNTRNFVSSANCTSRIPQKAARTAIAMLSRKESSSSSCHEKSRKTSSNLDVEPKTMDDELQDGCHESRFDSAAEEIHRENYSVGMDEVSLRNMEPSSSFDDDGDEKSEMEAEQESFSITNDFYEGSNAELALDGTRGVEETDIDGDQVYVNSHDDNGQHDRQVNDETDNDAIQCLDDPLSIPADICESSDRERGEDYVDDNRIEIKESFETKKSHSIAKIDIESLLLTNRESIYELQMDQELELGSRESLQRLIYGSDDDSSVWNSEPHLMECCLDNDHFALDLNAMYSNIVHPLVNDISKIVSSVEKLNSSEFIESASINDDDSSLTSVVDDSKQSSSEINDVLPTQKTSNVLNGELISKPKASSTPIKTSSKIPEATKANISQKPPPMPRTSSLAGKKILSQSSSSTQQNASNLKNNNKSNSKLESSSKESIREIDEKENSSNLTKNQKCMTTFGFKMPQNTKSFTSSVPKPPKNNTLSRKPPPSDALSKVPSGVTTSIFNKNLKQSRIALAVSNQKSKINNKTATKSAEVESTSTNCSIVDSKSGKLLSPYHTVTKPRVSIHSSSGHGSDSSSLVENTVVKSTSKTSEVEASSGYESMIRDSEVTGTSSSQESNSECTSSSAGKGRGLKIFRKKAKGRSRSAPARWYPVDGTIHVSRKFFFQRSRAVVVGQQCIDGLPEEPIEIKAYNSEDVERISRWRKKEAEMKSLNERRQRINELLSMQDTLKRNLAKSKSILMVDDNSWSYDLHVAENMNRDDPGYLLALEKETAILQKRIQACKSRIMMVTCFDVT